MAVTIFACPECQSTLKSAKVIAAGTKIKCPKCQTVFTMPERNGSAAEEEETQAGSRAPGAAKELPRKAGPKPPPLPRQSDDVAEYDDGNDEEEAPRPKKKKKKAKGKKKPLPINPALIGGIACVVLLLVAGYVVGWVWPGFFYRPGEEPLAYVPANSTGVLTINLEALPEPFGSSLVPDQFATGFVTGFHQLGLNPATFKKDTGLELKDMFQQITIATNEPLNPNTAGQSNQKGVIIFKSRVAFDRQKIVDHMKVAENAHRLKFKTYYQKKVGNETMNIFFPNDRLMVLSGLPEKDLAAVVTSRGKEPTPTGDLKVMIDKVNGSQAWVAMLMDANMKKNLEGVAGSIPGAGASLKDVINQGKSAGIWLAVENNQVKFNAGIMCADAETAGKAAKNLQSLWKTALTLANLSGAFAQIQQLPSAMQLVVNQLKDNVKFTSQDNLAQVSTQLSLQALKSAIDEAQKNPGALMGMGGFPQPGGPGGFPPPGGRNPQPGAPPRGGRRPR